MRTRTALSILTLAPKNEHKIFSQYKPLKLVIKVKELELEVAPIGLA
jgi:hypothetical protein